MTGRRLDEAFTFLCPGCDESLEVNGAMRDALVTEGCVVCGAAVTARVRQERLERRLGERRQPWLAAAAAALVVVGAGVVWRLMPPTSPATLGVPPATVTAAEAPGPEKRTEPPRVNVDMPGEGIRIYQYAQEPDDDTAVYFIVNPAMES